MDTFIMGYNDVQTKAAFLNIRTKILQMKKKLKKTKQRKFPTRNMKVSLQ